MAVARFLKGRGRHVFGDAVVAHKQRQPAWEGLHGMEGLRVLV